MSLDRLRAAIAAHPEFEHSHVSLLADGWDSVALDVDDRFILKFPRHDLGESSLRNEGKLLSLVTRFCDLPAPQPASFERPRFHTMHRKLAGTALDPAAYAKLDEAERHEIGGQLGRFYAQLHAIEPALWREAGAGPVQTWLDASAIRRRITPLLPSDLRAWAEPALERWAQLPPDPLGSVHGYFDGHGWNMAYDATNHQLTGVFDFADAGFGPLHQEFIYSNLISPDLTRRIMDSYEHHGGRKLDRDRITLLTDIHRLWELAEEHQHPENIETMIEAARAWLAVRP
jgi:aminoglycoside phosphotransferase (APT) family kinase protein